MDEDPEAVLDADQVSNFTINCVFELTIFMSKKPIPENEIIDIPAGFPNVPPMQEQPPAGTP